MKRYSTAILLFMAACGGSNQERPPGNTESAQQSWMRWHADKLAVDFAASEAINDPKGGDYAKAIGIIRDSDRPAMVKQFQVGMLIIQGFDDPAARRPPESLEQGMQMAEDATAQPGEMRETGPQKLRILFERGFGIAPNNVPIDKPVADCWHKLEYGGTGDRNACIALRRQHLPKLGT